MCESLFLWWDPTQCLNSIVSLLWLQWVRDVDIICVFCSNLPSALLAEWPGFIMLSLVLYHWAISLPCTNTEHTHSTHTNTQKCNMQTHSHSNATRTHTHTQQSNTDRQTNTHTHTHTHSLCLSLFLTNMHVYIQKCRQAHTPCILFALTSWAQSSITACGMSSIVSPCWKEKRKEKRSHHRQVINVAENMAQDTQTVTTQWQLLFFTHHTFSDQFTILSDHAFALMI